jgi:hypothetical protein
MPLVRIDIVKGVRSPAQVKKLADVVQRVLLDHFNAPPRDRYQVCSSKLWLDILFKPLTPFRQGGRR